MPYIEHFDPRAYQVLLSGEKNLTACLLHTLTERASDHAPVWKLLHMSPFHVFTPSSLPTKGRTLP